VHTPIAGYITDPQLATHNLQRAAEAKGGEFLFNTAVTGIRVENGRVAGVDIEDGTSIDAPIVVNVAGPHSFVINEMAGVADSMAIRPCAAGACAVRRVSTSRRKGCWSTRRSLSSARVGNHISWKSGSGYDPRSGSRPGRVRRNITESVAGTGAQARPQASSLSVPNEKGVVDLYDVSDDWIPIYDKTDLPGFYVAIGTSGNQFKNSHIASYCMLTVKAVGWVTTRHQPGRW
jgi:sarcosine oxidase subunit beta